MKTEKTEAKVVKTAEEREREFLAEREAEILKRYKNVTPGSLRREIDGHHAGKLTVEITCRRKRRDENGTEHECGNKRRVATSDLFQVKFCEECITELRLAKRRKKAKLARAAKKAEQAKPEKTKPEKAKPEKTKPEKGKLQTPRKKMRAVAAEQAEAAENQATEAQAASTSVDEVQTANELEVASSAS